MKTPSVSAVCFAVSLALVMMVTSPANGQGAAGSGNELDLLRNDAILDQLGLSAAQKEKLAEAAKGASVGREVFDPFLQRMKETDDEAERTKIREEMNQAIANAKGNAGVKALEILDSRQIKLLRTIYVQEAGVRAFSDPRVAEEMGLTDDQKKQIEELAAARRQAAADLSFDATEEQKEAFRKEWEAKYVAVLNDVQKKQWTELNAASASSVTAVPGIPGAGVSGGAASAMAEPPPGAEVVSSFGAASDASDGSQLVGKFSFNFRYAPWDQVLQDFATGAGYTLDMTRIPPGTFSHIDNKEYNAGQAMDILNGYLQRRGFALVLKDGFMVCVNVDNGIPPSLIPDVSVDDLLKIEQGTHKIGENEIARIQIPLKKLDVGVLAQEVEQLIGPIGSMTAFTETGSLIIADTGSNLRRVKSYLDAALAAREVDLQFKAYPLENIDAEEAEFMLLAQFGMRQGVPNVSAGGGGDRRGGPPAPTPAPAAATTLQVMSDTRTNSLFVTGSPDQHELVEEILKAIDIDKDSKGNPLGRAGSNAPYLRVYKVSGRADQVAQSVTAMMPGVVVNEDGAAGTIHIFATPKQHEQVEEWVRAFAEGSGAGGSVAVIPLAKMDPLAAAATLRNLFISEGTSAPTIETDLYGNRIIVKGTSIQVDLIKQVLADLGEDGTGVKQKNEGTIRRYSLRGRDPEEFFQYLQQEWESKERTSIRVVVPRKTGPIRDLRTPSSGGLKNFEERRPPAEEGDPTTQFRSRRFGVRKESGYFPVSRVSEESADQDGPTSASAPGENQPPRRGESAGDIQIVVDGDELLLIGTDEEALDRLEETMDFLQQSIPFRTKWTVFYLQAADATEAAALLEQFIPSSTVSSTAASSGFSLGSIFSPITQSVSNMTGLSGIGPNPQTLRIIPDTRSNSLFITGPQSMVDESERFLEILDSNDVPESLRDMQPRRLEVQHADIDDIANVINETFKPYIDPPAARQQQNNPLAQMFAGGGGRGNDQLGTQMTVSVDRQTSTLIVASSEALYNKVKTLVEELDASAKKANRTVRVVQLKHSDATVVQQSLTSLFPRVTSSATRSSSSSTNSSGGGAGAPPQGGAPDPFQQMMQDRMRQGGSSRGGGSPFGGGGITPFGGGGGAPFGGGSPFGGGGGGSPFGGRGGFGGGRGGR